MPQATNRRQVFEFVFGGTFDPVHNGHLAIIEQLRACAPELTIRLLPCAIPPLKAEPSTPFLHRVEMLQLATQGIDRVEIDCREQQRERPSYTIETLQSLTAEFPTRGFILVMGADSLVDLPKWHQWQVLAQHCHLLVFNRGEMPDNDVNQQLKESGFQPVATISALMSEPVGAGLLLQMPPKSESSTQIRDLKRVAIGAENDRLDTMLPQSVIEYIRNHHLYTSK